MTQSPPIIILLHGLRQRSWVMRLHQWRLRKQGYRTHIFDYRTSKGRLPDFTSQFHNFLGRLNLPAEQPINVMAHSLGSFVAMETAAQHPDLPWGRFVLLGPPLQGAQIARFLTTVKIGPLMFGPIIHELGQARRATLLDGREVGIIAGHLGCSCGFLPFLKGDNDGLVRVEETRFPGMKEHVLVHALHPFLCASARVTRLAERFIRCGTFMEER